MHLDVAFATLFDLLSTPRLLFLMAIAVPMGVFFGSTPGLGGKLGLVLLIPFVYNMDQLTGAVFLCAMHAVVHTGGSIPSILIGVPGDGPAAATGPSPGTPIRMLGIEPPVWTTACMAQRNTAPVS